MAFSDVRYPTAYAYDPGGGSKYSVTISQSEGGQEARSPSWGGLTIDYGLAEFDLHSRPLTGQWGSQSGSWTPTPRADYNAFMAFWDIFGQGPTNGFRFNFWFDNYAYRNYLINTVTGTIYGDGATTTFQLCRQRVLYSTTMNKIIYKQLGTHNTTVTEYLNVNPTSLPLIQQTTTAPLLYASADPMASPLATSVYTINNMGLVTFTTAPALAATPTATFYFDYPVRFDVDLPPMHYSKGVFTLDDIHLVELRGAI